MSFMEPQIEQGQWYEIETTQGVAYLPSDVVSVPVVRADDECPATEHNTTEEEWTAISRALRDHVDGEPESVCIREGFGARLSAPGYMDCTDWAVFETEQEARDYLREESGIDDRLGAMDRADLLTILEEHDPEIDADRGTEELRELIARMVADGEIDGDNI
jgi:hypothetical protein